MYVPDNFRRCSVSLLGSFLCLSVRLLIGVAFTYSEVSSVVLLLSCWYIVICRPHTLNSTSTSKSFQSTVTGELNAPYSKQFVHSKSSQYRRMKTEWKSNVYLARSRIQVRKEVELGLKMLMSSRKSYCTLGAERESGLFAYLFLCLFLWYCDLS